MRGRRTDDPPLILVPTFDRHIARYSKHIYEDSVFGLGVMLELDASRRATVVPRRSHTLMSMPSTICANAGDFALH